MGFFFSLITCKTQFCFFVLKIYMQFFNHILLGERFSLIHIITCLLFLKKRLKLGSTVNSGIHFLKLIEYINCGVGCNIIA